MKRDFHALLDELKRGGFPPEAIDAFTKVRDTLVYARDMAKTELGEDISPEICVQICDMMLEQEEILRERQFE
jgi:hypothetical protein